MLDVTICQVIKAWMFEKNTTCCHSVIFYSSSSLRLHHSIHNSDPLNICSSLVILDDCSYQIPKHFKGSDVQAMEK
jgi:hypothetical protein